MFWMGPVYLYFMTGKRYPLMLYKIPGTNFDSLWGYCINSFAQFVMSIFVAVPNVGYDCTFAMMLSSLWAGADYTNYSLRQIEKDLKTGELSTGQKCELKKIMMEIQELER